MVVLDMALQRCAVHSRMPPGVLCRAVQELHRCLTTMIESGDQFDLNMLDEARRDPMAPASAERAPLLTPRMEELISVSAPNDPPSSEPKEAVQPQELALVPRRRLPVSPGFTLSWVDES